MIRRAWRPWKLWHLLALVGGSAVVFGVVREYGVYLIPVGFVVCLALLPLFVARFGVKFAWRVSQRIGRWGEGRDGPGGDVAAVLSFFAVIACLLGVIYVLVRRVFAVLVH